MITYLTTCTVFALLLVRNGICDGSSSEYAKNQPVEFIPRYNSNHPPLPNYEDIPVKVIYDDQEDIINVPNYLKSKNRLEKKVFIEDDTDSDEESSTDISLTTVTESVDIPHDDVLELNETKLEDANEKNVTATFENDDLIDIDLTEVNERKDIKVKTVVHPRARSLNVESLPGAYTTNIEPSAPAYDKTTPSSIIETTTKQRRKSSRKRLQNVPKSDKAETEPEIITIDNISPRTITLQKSRTLSSSFNVPDIPLLSAQPASKQTNKREKRIRARDPVVPIIESENYVYSHRGNFHYSYEGGDGTKAFEKGELKSIDGGTGESVEGSFSYTDKEGNAFSLSYTADENGYRPVGDHLPTPPPIPPAIQRALELLATKTTPEDYVTEKVKKTY